MTTDMLNAFRINSLTFNNKTELEEWFDMVDEQTKKYVNESEVPKRRNKSSK